MTPRVLSGCERLENRLCLTVIAEVVDGDLNVSGEADGPIQIIAQVEEASFLVTDNGAEVGTFEGVTDDIRIQLDMDDTATDDDVTLDLTGATVDRVIAKLGDGDNRLAVQGGEVGSSLMFRSGEGNDVLEIAAEAVVTRNVYAFLGEGENTVDIDGTVERNLIVKTGADADQVLIDEGAVIQRSVSARLGDGANVVNHAGEIGRNLHVRAGVDDDAIEIMATAMVERSVSLSLGAGNNQLNGAGEIGGNLIFRGGDGNDTVNIGEDDFLAGSVRIHLGSGDNSVVHAGEIEGRLFVRSANSEDTVSYDDGIVGGGDPIVILGEDVTAGRPGRPPFGRGRIGVGGFGFRSFGGRGFSR
jgi:hypothetical protein